MNIVLVLTDDFTGNLIRYMPHLVAMERSGTTFPNYIVDNSMCCPSRSSLLTGQYAHDTHIFSNLPPTGGFVTFHDRGEEQHTFATALSAVGYRTALMGKYLNHYEPAESVDGQIPFVPPGWTEWDVAGYGYDGYNYNLAHNHTVQHFGNAPADYLNTVLAARARSFITAAARNNRPFLLEMAPFTPHAPATPAPRDARSFARLRVPHAASFGRLPTNPPSWLAKHPPLTPTQIRHMNVAFRRRVQSVQSVDRLLGDLEQTVASTGEASRTIFLFTSDNGYHMGEHRLLPGKLTAYDTDIRIPLIVDGPGIPAGVRNPALVQNVDLAPTFERIAHAAVPVSTDGRSLLPLMGATAPYHWPTLALSEAHGPINTRTDDPRLDPDSPLDGSGNPPTYQAIRSAGFTYVRYANGAREYYNLRRDPAELHNIYRTLGKQRRQRLNREVAALVNCHNAVSCQRARYLPRP